MASLQGNQSVVKKLYSAVEKTVANSTKTPVIIAIDGNCGSGKTFYSSQLASSFNACVIHCDDFFLPKEMRTTKRLAEVGGNIHYERLCETLSRLKNDLVSVDGKKQFTYMAYNCSTDSYEERRILPSNVIIVEGSYSLHPTLRQFYDLKILLKVDRQTQYNRLLQREGEQGISNFVNKWIPLENRYFEALNTADCVVIDTSPVGE